MRCTGRKSSASSDAFCPAPAPEKNCSALRMARAFASACAAPGWSIGEVFELCKWVGVCVPAVATCDGRDLVSPCPAVGAA